MSSKLIVVFGATGKQGGSVINALRSSSAFKLRGVTRDPSKGNAQALSKQGVEMVAGDLNDAASLEAAVKGAYGVFAVTDYWATMDSPGEIKQGKSIADAAKKAGVEHFVLSTLLGPKECESVGAGARGVWGHGVVWGPAWRTRRGERASGQRRAG